jgi:hypothetical protein
VSSTAKNFIKSNGEIRAALKEISKFINEKFAAKKVNN